METKTVATTMTDRRTNLSIGSSDAMHFAATGGIIREYETFSECYAFTVRQIKRGRRLLWSLDKYNWNSDLAGWTFDRHIHADPTFVGIAFFIRSAYSLSMRQQWQAMG
jgi:hypothetical protein